MEWAEAKDVNNAKATSMQLLLRLRAPVLTMQEGFFGMLPIRRAKFEGELQKYGMGWSKSLKIAGAVCNGLVMKGKTSVIGDALEKQLFKAVEAQYVVSMTDITRFAACCNHARL